MYQIVCIFQISNLFMWAENIAVWNIFILNADSGLLNEMVKFVKKEPTDLQFQKILLAWLVIFFPIQPDWNQTNY